MTVFEVPATEDNSTADATSFTSSDDPTRTGTSAPHGVAGGALSRSSAEGRSPRAASRSKKAHPLIPALLVDSSPLFRAGLTHILTGSRFRVRVGCSRLSELSESAFKGKHCIALINLGGQAAAILAAVSRLTDQHHGLRVVVLTEQFSPDELFAAIEAGATGYLLKNEITPDALLRSLDLVLLGGVVIPQGLTNLLKERVQPRPDAVPSGENPPMAPDGERLRRGDNAPQPDGPGHLSNREQVILQQLTQGASNKQIARDLDIAEATVKVHIKSLLRKIRVNNRTQAAMWAMERVRPNGAMKGRRLGFLAGEESETA